MADRKSLTTGRRRQRREGAWPKGMYAYQNGDGFFFERRSRKVRGGRVWEPLGEDRNRAIARSTELNDAINRGDYEKSSSSGRRLTVSEFFEVALATREGHAPKTYAGYRSRVAHFLTYLNSEHPRLFRLSDVSSDVARGYLDWRRDMEVTRCGWKRSTTPTNRPAEFTLETDANRLRTLFQVGVERGFIGTNPFTRITPPKSKGKAKPDRTTARSLTETQARSLLKAARDYDQSPRGEGGQSTFKGQMYDMTRLYLLTGLRNRELIYLPWVHVDLDWEETGLIQIKPFDIRVTLHIHPSPLQAKRIDALAESRHPEQPLFESRTILDTCLPSHYLKIGRTFTKGDKQEHDDRIAALLACRSHDWDADRRCLNAPTRIRWRQKSTAGSTIVAALSRKSSRLRSALCSSVRCENRSSTSASTLRWSSVVEFERSLTMLSISPCSTPTAVLSSALVGIGLAAPPQPPAEPPGEARRPSASARCTAGRIWSATVSRAVRMAKSTFKSKAASPYNSLLDQSLSWQRTMV